MSKITGQVADDWFGTTVDISSDATTLSIGAPIFFQNTNENTRSLGYVEIFSLDNGTHHVQTIGGEDAGDYHGWAMALSTDSSTLAVGAFSSNVNGTGSGQVIVYQRVDDGQYQQIGSNIVGSPGDTLGHSVSVSSDGLVLAAGSPGNNGSAGQVIVFFWDYDSNDFLPRGEPIQGDAAGDILGWHSTSIALSKDGNTLVVGALGGRNSDGEKSGYVKVYRWNESTSNYQLLGSAIEGKADKDDFGYSLDVSADGNIVAIGAPGSDDNNIAGYVQIYEWSYEDLIWIQLGENLSGQAAYDNYGRAVALAADGMTLAVGARDNDGNGDSSGQVKVYTYVEALSSYVQLGQSIYGESATDLLGWSVSLSADGETLVVGSPWNDNNGSNSGCVQVFKVENKLL